MPLKDLLAAPVLPSAAIRGHVGSFPSRVFTIIIDAVLLLKELCAALLESDVNVKLVASLRSRVKTKGAGKTTTCTKLAVHYRRRGFRTCLVCADTFRAGAFDQLKQNATKAKILFYGSYTETDPVAIASLDTSGRHKQESELFEEMVVIGGAVKPDTTIMVLDVSVGQVAEAQSRASKDSADFGAIIVTKLDGHAKGGGAISAVAATKAPIISSLVPARNGPSQPGQAKGSRQKAKFSMCNWKDQLSNIMGMVSISKIASMIPGLPAGMMDGGGDEEAASKVKRMIFITDAMRADELDSDGLLILITFDKTGSPTGLNRRAKRAARGSGTSLREVEELLVQVKMMAGMAKQAGGQYGWMSATQKMQAAAGGKPLGPNGQPSPAQIAVNRKAVPPEIARKFRAAGPQGPQKIMADMMSGMGGGGGGMPDLGSFESTWWRRWGRGYGRDAKHGADARNDVER
ncbi:signal recognition particle protein SRP54 [Cryptococcus wingfieldii CBS 7118]|uniref:Signal recognition particle 54 kDa protein homolog n=1 Tax=Cryptococcus wingfieldii CBS 7118 TaxID=1295528 RepID=A0A1E3IT10_9TREE|nr:signal recognition particle protein SRP54 [Cryptococcus wingfieldii CBS 7118]ODN90841.1 signal recognition particle protein SRP54 [Cryptococcus wingfieldii CBS 7118]